MSPDERRKGFDRIRDGDRPRPGIKLPFHSRFNLDMLNFTFFPSYLEQLGLQPGEGLYEQRPPLGLGAFEECGLIDTPVLAEQAD